MPAESARSMTPMEKARASPVATTLETPRGKIEFATLGDGPAVLALHGAMGGWDQSLLLARSLGAPGFRYVAVSRPGYLGTALSAGRTPEAQADLYAALLDALGIRRAAVAAVSGGGPSALAFALRHPDRCWAVVMISAASARIDVPVPFAWQVMKLVARFPALVTRMRGRMGRDPDATARRSIPDPALRARTLADPEAAPLLAALQASSLDRMRERIAGTENDIATTRRDLGLPLDRIAAPLLAVHGTADRMVPFEMSRALAARLPGAELLAIEGGEHVALFTHLAEVRARAGRFLRAHAPAAP